ncbi:MAG TPA: type IV secretion system DNA-binding domain-containing protein [Steroidobacteraceae bacterium]|jgi:type IV secretory pathway TraG/TraD family ATPase VirD4|nr:type IV secretion system DNA-binding domain-containing protein [Steroidobacteraceae bacterium]
MTAATWWTTLAQGWSGLGLMFSAVQAPLLTAMVRGRAQWRSLLLSPLTGAATTVAAGIGIVLSGPALRGLGVAADGLAQWAVGCGICIASGYAVGRRVARADAARKPTAAAAEMERPMKWEPGSHVAREGEVVLAGVRVPILDETKHFKVVGTTGTGKSTAIGQLLEHALARGDRAIIADPDGGYLRRFYDKDRGDIILNPFDQRSMKWDLFAEIEREYDVDQLARSLLPDQEGDRTWRGYARTFLSSITRQLHATGVREVGELYRLLTSAGTPELATLTRGTPAEPFLEENNERMFLSLRSVAASAVASLEYIAQQRSSGFSIRKWVWRDHRERPGVLFLPYRAGQIAALRSMISAWMRVGIYAAMDRPEGDQRLWFVVDELDALGPIDGLKDALARVRKFGGRCVLGFQSLAQVASTYGDGEARTLVENCGNTFIFRCSASDGGGTARFASTLIGQREVRRVTGSRSRRDTDLFGTTSRSEHYSVEPAVLPSQIEQIPDLCGYLKLASRPEWLRTRVVAMRPAETGREPPEAFLPAPPAALSLPVPARSSSPKSRPRTRSPKAAQGSQTAQPKRSPRARRGGAETPVAQSTTPEKSAGSQERDR